MGARHFASARPPALDQEPVTPTESPRSTVPHQALYRRWRAQTFTEIVGQQAVVETLRNAVRAGRVSHAILFVGPRGTGKTSLARILAKAVNCTNLQDGDPCDRCEACVSIREGRAIDLIEIDAASNRGIADIRDLRERINYAPTDLKRKVYILDEAHQITKDAWNALLKSLEEPPDFVTFMFASTHPQDFPPAILSRLQRFDVRRLTVPEIEGKLRKILAAESVEAEPAAIHLVARLAAGGMRDAESMLDQLLAASGGQVTEANVRDLLGLADADAVDALVAALAEGDAAAGIAVLDELEDRGRDLGVVLDQAVELVRVPSRRLVRDRRRRRHRPPDTGRPEPRRDRPRAARRGWAATPGRAGAVRGADRAGRASGSRSGALAGARERHADTGRRAHAGATGPDDRPSDQSRTARARARRGRLQPGAAAAAPSPSRAAHREPEPPAAEPEPPAADAGAAAEPPAAAPQGSDLDRLLTNWAEIVTSVRPATRAVITECRPMSVDGNVVTLGFPEAKAFLKDVAERKRADLEAAVGGFLGRPVSVRCVATNIDLVPAASGDDEAGRIFAEAKRIFEDDLVDVGEVS